MSSPRPVAPISGAPATSAEKRTQRVRWIQRFIEVLTSAPRYLSSTARLFSAKRLVSTPWPIAWSCRSHSPPWSQIGQSSGWLISRNSMMPRRASRTRSVFVLITMPSPAGIAQDAIGFGAFSISTRHIRQFAGTESLSWKQNRGTSRPRRSQACSTDVPGSTSISTPSIVSLGIGAFLFRSFAAMGMVAVVADPLLHLVAEMPDQRLDRPGGCVAEGADAAAVDLLGDLEQHV